MRSTCRRYRPKATTGSRRAARERMRRRRRELLVAARSSAHVPSHPRVSGYSHRLRPELPKSDRTASHSERVHSLNGPQRVKLHHADTRFDTPGDFVFATSRSTQRNPFEHHAADPPTGDRPCERRTREAGAKPDRGSDGPLVAAHVLRTLYEAGASPAYVMAQMGHTDASLALEIYSKVMGAQARHRRAHGRAHPRR
jgi:hypothetical protein